MVRAKPTPFSEKELDKIINGMRKEPRNMVFSLELINQKIIERTLVLNPEYQRNYVLTVPEASKFVESVFLGCVIPEVQLFEESDGTLEVIDGQQRLTALIKFYNNEYALTRLHEIPNLNRYKFNDLPLKLQNKFKNYLMSCKIMKNDDDSNYKFMIFERLNSGAKKLTKQEIRNCIYQGPMLTLAKELTKEEVVRDNLKFNWSNLKRQEFDEFILRLMATIEYFPNDLLHAANFNINKILEDYNKKSPAEIKTLKNKFLKTLNIYGNLISKKYIMNKKGVVTKSNIESVITLLHAINTEIYTGLDLETINNNKTLFNETINEVITTNASYQEFVWQSDSKNSLLDRTKLLHDALLEAYEENEEYLEKIHRNEKKKRA